jgi:hypothetical protein
MKKIFEKKPTFEEMKEVSKKLWKISEWSSDEFTILMPPPNVTGALHIGHALTYSIQDTIVRLQQSLNGRKGFLISGFDHGGISTQISFLKQQTENSEEDQLLSFKEKISNLYFTNNIKDLDSLEIIFILSPNNTHFHYIKKFSNKKKYIFCEKPAFTTINEYKYLERLKRFQKERIFFNFNYEFSEYFENLKKEFENKNNGKLINFSFSSRNFFARTQSQPSCKSYL